MEIAEFVTVSLEGIQDDLVRVLNSLSDEELHRQPRHDCNSIAWLAWHLTREHDYHLLSFFAGQEQAWVEDGWHARFGMEPDPSNRGLRHTPEQVAAFRTPDVQTLLDYYDAVLKRSRAYLATVKPEEVDRLLDGPQQWRRPITVAIRLASVIDELSKHMGQIAYLRGLYQGMGWQRF